MIRKSLSGRDIYLLRIDGVLRTGYIDDLSSEQLNKGLKGLIQETLNKFK